MYHVSRPPYRPEFRDTLVDLWRASFEHGVGIRCRIPSRTTASSSTSTCSPRPTCTWRCATARSSASAPSRPSRWCSSTCTSTTWARASARACSSSPRRHSCGKLWLYTFVTNPNAQRFYERHGFDVVERGFEPVMQLGDLRYEWKRPVRLRCLPGARDHARPLHFPTDPRHLMPASFDTHLLTVAPRRRASSCGASIRASAARSGASACRTVRPWITVVVFPLIVALVLASQPPASDDAAPRGRRRGRRHRAGRAGHAADQVRGDARGAVLHAQRAPGHRAVAADGAAPRLPLRDAAARSAATFDPQSMQLGASPLTMAIFGTLAGYYVDLRDRPAALARASRSQSPAEH